MPIGDSIGSEGLTQGGPNLGDDISRPLPKVEQNETTNVGTASTKKKADDTDASGNEPPHSTVEPGDTDEERRSKF